MSSRLGPSDEATAEGSPVVTVVVPLYNGGRFVRETLRSVLAQSFDRFEVIVVDDGSTDDGPDRVREESDPRVRLVSGPHSGVARARNTGAALSSDDVGYLLFLDADDVLSPGALAAMVDALGRRPDAVGAFVLADYIDADGNPLRDGDFSRHMRARQDLRDGHLVPRDRSADVHVEHLFVANHVYPPSCLLIRRSAYESAGGFDPRFIAEDWEFVIRLARRGPLVPVDQVMVGYRRHTSNLSGSRGRNVLGARQVWAAVYHAPGTSEAESERIRAIWRAHQARTSGMKLAEGRALLARGRLLPGVARILDGIAHVLLRRPPRIWAHVHSEARSRTWVQDDDRTDELSRSAG